jgi:hypothetical protein
MYELLRFFKRREAHTPDGSGFLPFVGHIQIIERSLLRDLNQALQQAHSDEQCAIL